MLARILSAVCSIALAGSLAGCAAEASSSPRQDLVPASSLGAGIGGLPAAKRHTSSTNCGSTIYSFVGGGSDNTASAVAAGILAGGTNTICGQTVAIIGGGAQNNISTTAGDAEGAFIGAGYTNTVSGNNASYAFIGAGDYNTATGYSASILGGEGNTVSGEATSVGGGNGNSSAGQNALIGAGQTNSLTSAAIDGLIGSGFSNTLSAEYGVIGGGEHNNVSGEGGYIAAGGYNTVAGEGAVIDGGFNNAAAGTFATIPGGYVNSAAGTYSFAAGARASAAQTGAFVWSDGSDGDTILTSSRAYQFLARASGGVTFWTNAASTVGATLAAGSGTWASASDRTLKTDVASVDDAVVLDRVAALPISRWSYKSERGVRHLGPMAQDFYAAFGVGEDDKHITAVDEDGVALAAIKALHAENQRLRRRLAAIATADARRDAHQRRVDLELSRIEARLQR